MPYAPISPAYSLISQDYGKLRHILGTLTPGLVFAASGGAYAQAIAAVVPADDVGGASAAERRASRAAPRTPFADLLATVPGAGASTPRMRRVGPDTSPSSCSPRARPSCPRA